MKSLLSLQARRNGCLLNQLLFTGDRDVRIASINGFDERPHSRRLHLDRRWYTGPHCCHCHYRLAPAALTMTRDTGFGDGISLGNARIAVLATRTFFRKSSCVRSVKRYDLLFVELSSNQLPAEHFSIRMTK
jgi:hypothetical protein